MPRYDRDDLFSGTEEFEPPAPPSFDELTGEGEDVVELLLDELEPETRPQPLVTVEGMRGKGAIVTGASSGIGRAIALEFARTGVNIAFNFLDDGTPEARDNAERVRRELHECDVRVFSRSCDVRDPSEVTTFVEQAHRTLGGLHILVNNAGISRDRALWRLDDREWAEVVDTNLTGAFYFIRAMSPHFRAQEYGKVVNIASVHGISSEFGLVAYSSSKAGLIGLTRSAAVELGPSNVNVNAVAPGYIRTTTLTERVPAELLDRARERAALGRLGDPRDVASVVLFLCSEAARHVTGAVIPIDGGYLH